MARYIAFLWTTKFQSGQVKPKSYLPSLATGVWVCLQHWFIIHLLKYSFQLKHFCLELFRLTTNAFT